MDHLNTYWKCRQRSRFNEPGASHHCPTRTGRLLPETTCIAFGLTQTIPPPASI